MTEQLKADSSDRPVSSKPKDEPRFRLSRQHIMILIAIIILLLLVLGISSALSPESESQTKEVAWSQSDTTAATEATVENKVALEPTQLQPPPVADVTTQSDTPVNRNKERVEIPSDVTDALMQQQSQPVLQSDAVRSHDVTQSHQVPTNIKAEARPQPRVIHDVKPASPLAVDLPASHFTIQVSASSNRNNLIAYAKKHNLAHYSVYETSRENRAWFVLIVGNYKTTAEARNAISALPEEIQQQKPWVKSGLRVQEEQRLKNQ